jgi:DNA-binding NtrC family response regulator
MRSDQMRVLLLAIEPRADLHGLVARALPGATVRQLPPGRDPGRVLREARPHLLLLAPCLTDHGGAEAILRAVGDAVEPTIVALSEVGDPRTAVALVKSGVSEWLPVSDAARLLPEVLRNAGPRRPARRAGGATAPARAPRLIGVSPALDEVRRGVATAAETGAPVLIEGETGTGKEVVARRIHALGGRAGAAFVPVNCAAIPETLAETELFGHARGAFTGAVQDHPGALLLADRGTLFLDELEDLPPAVQAKLLRVVQDGEVRPVGGATTRRVDVRIVAASNRDLRALVEAGRFRSDLYYRLRVLTIHVPPLRERREDVLVLAEHFVERFNAREGTCFRLPASAACRPLLEHAWPGNVRELENTLEALLIRARAAGRPLGALLTEPAHPTGPWLDERGRILRLLELHRWNRQRTAAALGISRVTLWRRMERHGIRDAAAATDEVARARAAPAE